jgi:hypothetical protein
MLLRLLPVEVVSYRRHCRMQSIDPSLTFTARRLHFVALQRAITMGLAVTVGILSEMMQDDPESAEDFQGQFALISDILAARGLPPHAEPEMLPPLDSRDAVGSYPYSFLHQLRRFYAYCVRPAAPSLIQRLLGGAPAQQPLPPPLKDGEDASNDPVLQAVASPRHHLLWHSDAEGYYVPVDFPEVIVDDRLPGESLGSSVRLLAELKLIAPRLEIPLDDGELSDDAARQIDEEAERGGLYSIERIVWLNLFEAARLSIKHGAAIHFG